MLNANIYNFLECIVLFDRPVSNFMYELQRILIDNSPNVFSDADSLPIQFFLTIPMKSCTFKLIWMPYSLTMIHIDPLVKNYGIGIRFAII